MDKKNLSLLLSSNQNIGARTFKKLRQFGIEKLPKIFHQDLLDNLVGQKIASEIRWTFKNQSVAKIKNNLKSKKVEYITIYDPDYPKLLKQIYDPPQVLYFQGNINALKKRSIAIVGARNCTSYGAKYANKFAKELSRYDLNIVSGLALGIDGQAHAGSLETEGITTAVLGNGLPDIYPANHANLARRILAGNGLIISEYPLEYVSYPANFPLRNRIIAGVSEATIIIEGSEKSGSLITASLALNFNRDVFALPHSVDSRLGVGPNNLIKAGAYLAQDTSDILNVLNIEPEKASASQKLTEDEQKIVSILNTGNFQPDEIIKKCGLDISAVNSNLVLLEIKGIVKHTGGNKYELR